MATRPIVHRFIPVMDDPFNRSWLAQYPVPIALLHTGAANEETPAFIRDFQAALLSILPQYQSSIDANIGGFRTECMTCGQRGTTAVPLPTSQLSAPEPCIIVQVLPTCGKAECARLADEMMHVVMREEKRHLSGGSGRGQDILASPQVPTEKCQGCGKPPKKRMVCPRCRTVYCNKDCQKGDWKAHKSICAQIAQAHAELTGLD